MRVFVHQIAACVLPSSADLYSAPATAALALIATVSNSHLKCLRNVLPPALTGLLGFVAGNDLFRAHSGSSRAASVNVCFREHLKLSVRLNIDNERDLIFSKRINISIISIFNYNTTSAYCTEREQIAGAANRVPSPLS
jgi:hypothetical protein